MELKELQVRKDIELMERNNESNQSQKELTNEREFILREREEEHRHEERMELLRTLQLNPDMAPEIVKTVYLEGTNNRKVYNVSTHKNGEIIQMPTNDRKE